MLNVFQLASNDQSIVYLGQVFGNVGVALAGTGPALLSVMFKVFNTALLSVGALMVAYTTVVGVFLTAQEGKFLGGKWNPLWVPLRTLGGIVALFPTKSGYCALQVVVMWCIVQGVGAADMVWSAATNYLSQGGAVSTAATSQADMTGAAPALISNLFSDLVCQAAAVKFKNDTSTVVATSLPLYLRNQQGQDKQYGYKFGRPAVGQEPLDPTSECGQVTWADSSQSTLTPMQMAQAKAMQTLVPVLELVASYYVNLVINNPNCWQPYSTDMITNQLIPIPPPCPDPTAPTCQRPPYFQKW